MPRGSHWDGAQPLGRRKNLGADRKVLTSFLSRRCPSLDKFPNSYATRQGGYATTLGVEFRGLAGVENFSSSDYRRFRDDRPIIGDFATKQIDLDTSSLLHPGGSNAA
jgi:hypothetical protein